MPSMPIDQSPEWQALAAHHRAVRDTRMSDLFAKDTERAKRFTTRLADIRLDYSKNRITDETMTLLRNLARAADIRGWTEKLFGGAAINTSENRPVLHTALRQRSGHVLVAGKDVIAEIAGVRERMARFANSVRDGTKNSTLSTNP